MFLHCFRQCLQRPIRWHITMFVRGEITDDGRKLSIRSIIFDKLARQVAGIQRPWNLAFGIGDIYIYNRAELHS